ncbi:3-hydroxyacyl-CoA dehydrogenase family protein, partial [Amycolatopsis lurida]|uniref:3-hydroxyacyl-CoA dehydrogenase family protein n=1 Tax=Amycolatopsis lurida TaxID=31959 RepID=UPI0036667237
MTLVGVVGAGVMGTGVAQNLATSGHEAVLIDVDPGKLADARDRIELECRMSRMLGGPEIDAAAVLGRITFGTELALLAEAEVVIENITENWDLKSRLYPKLDEACKADTVFVVNTSAIPITKVAALTRRQDKVMGVHFMNPVPMKPSCEFIPGYHTSESTKDTVRELLLSMGKKPIPVNDASGFVSNRVHFCT